MRPLRLTMVAFGPFADRVEIDWTRLESRDLVLIEGPTGAGKTSILDAICFALYGVVPGARGEALAELRSAWADPRRTCEVTFDFAVGVRSFRVRRSPAQERPKQRGSGSTVRPAQAALFELTSGSERPLCAPRVHDVDGEIVGLVGLTAPQFQKVLLLPQGEFRQLLLAPSLEKEKLLERLFGTELYKRAAEVLCEERDRVEARANELMRLSEDVLARRGVTDVDALRARIEALQGELAAGEVEAERVGVAAAKARAAHATAAELGKRFAVLDAARNEEKALERERERIEAVRRRLLEAERVEPLAERFALEAAAREGAERLTREAGERVRAQAAAEAALARSRDQAADLPARKARLEALTGEEGALAALVPVEEEAHSAARSAARARVEAEKLALRADRARQAADAAEASADAARRAREHGIAAELAGALVGGEPCPVCGSPVHPAPARDEGRAPNLDAIAALEESSRRAHEAFVQAEQQRGATGGEAAALEERARTLGDRLALAAGSARNAGETLAAAWARVKEERARLARAVEATERAMLAAERDCEAAVQVAARAAEAAALELERHADTLHALEREAFAVGFADLPAARLARLEAAEMRRAREAISTYERRAAACQRVIDESLRELAGRERVDAELLGRVADEAAAQAAAAQKGVGEAKNALREHEESLRQVLARHAQYQELDESLRVLGTLAQVVSGDNARRMSLSRFVLAHRIEEVAVAASQRLSQMSRGRYVLRRTEEARRGRAAGLDLVVDDRHVGTERSVQSLSGGEMFMASLSLALGLADVVTRRAGGVRMDSLFIDEGFGTLDDETLDQVMRTLAELTAGRRLVGVISHVAELKERIPSRLTVKRGERGSVVSLRA